MNKLLKKCLTVTSLSIAGMYAFNNMIEKNLVQVSPAKDDQTCQWKDMKINYRVKGKEDGQPLLLIHNLFPSSSKEEWYKIDKELAKNYHLYELDLPGCGKSDKPNLTYINYMYVQVLQDFVKKVIKEKTNVCVTAYSSSFVLMTARMDPDLFKKILIINPSSVEDLVAPVTKVSGLKKRILEAPVIGRFIYNCKMSRASLADDYKYIYFYNNQNVTEKEIDIAYYNAHYKKSSGRYLLASIIGNYTNINIVHALPLIQNEIYLIGSRQYRTIMSEYKKYNPKIHTSNISNCRLLPQLEIPETIIEKITSILN